MTTTTTTRRPTSIPAGRYALTHTDGHIYFFQVDRPEHGKWAGWTFVKRISGDNLLRISKEESRQVLAAIASNPLAAARRYGRERMVCGMCRHGLTDDKSLKLGIGPDCIKKHFGITQAQAVTMRTAPTRVFEDETNNDHWDAEIQRREREEDERVAAYKARRDGF